MDDKKKKLLIGVAAGAGILVAGVGATVAIMSSSHEGAGKAGYTTNTPTAADVEAQPGELSIEPMPISLTRTPDGKIQAIATVSALFKDFQVTSARIEGNPQLSFTSDCLGNNHIIKAGERCNVVITFNAQSNTTAAGPPAVLTGVNPSAPPTNQPAAAPAGLQPELVIIGNSSTPGGSVIPIEKRAPIANADANAPMAQADPSAVGAPGSMPIGAPAAGSLDPYGQPISTVPTAGTMSAGSLPTAPMTAADATVAPPSPPPLSPREQFMLARRQAVFKNVQPQRRQQEAQKPYGTWADLNIPTATSSLPQDMSRVVTMDRIITAVLVRPYDSRASQQVIAQVDRNVYGAHGRNVLIPRGSQIIGIAQGGAERVAIQWKQIIRPDGARFVIEATAGDAMGQANVPGKVNSRLLKRYGNILLGTVLKAGTARVFGAAESPGGDVIGSGTNVARNNGAIISDIVRADVERIVSDITQRNSNVQPIISVPAGTRLTIIPTMDLQMRPMEAPTQEVRSYPRRQNGGGAPSEDDSGFDAPQARTSQRREVQPPFPTTDVPSTGTTPPWESN